MIRKIKNFIAEVDGMLRYDFPQNEWSFHFEKDYRKWTFYCGREFYDWWWYGLIIGPFEIYSGPSKL